MCDLATKKNKSAKNGGNEFYDEGIELRNMDSRNWIKYLYFFHIYFKIFWII